MSAAAQRFTQIMCQAAHIRTRRTHHIELHKWRFKSRDVELFNTDGYRGSCDRSSTPGKFVRGDAADFLCRKGRRYLFDITRETADHHFDLFEGTVKLLFFTRRFSLTIKSIGGEAKPHLPGIFF